MGRLGMSDELEKILSKIYVETPEVPNKVIGLSRNMIVELEQVLSDYIKSETDREVLEIRCSERAWAYRNMRNHGTDPVWVEIAKGRFERVKEELQKGKV